MASPAIALQHDFTAGELSASLLGRVDLAKYSKGGRTMRNFIVQSQGPAVKRPGFQLIAELPGPAVLLEFVFNNDQTYALILGEKWMRVATHEGIVLSGAGDAYQIETPYTLEQARQLSYVQSADVVFIACREKVPTKLVRLGHADWRFEPMTFTSPLPAPKWDQRTLVNNWSEYPLTHKANSAYYQRTGTDSRDRPTYSYHPIGEDLYRKVDKSSSYTVANLSFVNGAKNSDGSHSAAQLVTPYTYYVTAINKDGKESELSDGAKITGPSSNNWQAGDYVVLRWLAAEGAEEYRVYKSEFGGRPGYLATVKDVYYHDYNVSASISEGAPKYLDPFVLKNDKGEDVPDYPSVVCLFEQRLVFASTPKRPQTVWMSKSGDYTNFATYSPITDDAPLELTIASQEVSSANWMVPLRSLIFGTSSMEWEIAGRGEAAFSAKNAKATPQSYWGSSLKRAMIVGNVILHISSSGSQVRNLQYDFGSDSYGGTDLSILASHLLENQSVIDWAYQKNPDSIIWAVRSDGVLLGLTFQTEHQISAWHRHDTQGQFTAVCSVPHGETYDVFAVVLRGDTYYLERMAKRYLGGDPSHAVFLDCALTYTGSATKVVKGLSHLEGKTVGVFSKGAVEAERVVQDGKITLDAPSALVTVGLLYTADLETMPVEIMTHGGASPSVGLKKQINSLNITFHESLGVKAGLSTNSGNLDSVKWQDVKLRINEPFGVPPAPFSGIIHLKMPNSAENTLSICIRSELPTPVAVQSIMSRIEVKP